LSFSSPLDIFLLSESSTKTKTLILSLFSFASFPSSPSFSSFCGGRSAIPTIYLSNFSITEVLNFSSFALISFSFSLASFGSFSRASSSWAARCLSSSLCLASASCFSLLTSFQISRIFQTYQISRFSVFLPMESPLEFTIIAPQHKTGHSVLVYKLPF